MAALIGAIKTRQQTERHGLAGGNPVGLEDAALRALPLHVVRHLCAGTGLARPSGARPRGGRLRGFFTSTNCKALFRVA